MRTSLETLLEAVNPLDCNLEAVLPDGVHTLLSTLQVELSSGFKPVKEWKEDKHDSSREMAVQMVEANRQMAGQMVQMAAQLQRAGGRDVQASQAPLLLNSQNSQQPAGDEDDEEESLEKAKRHLMKPSYQSLHVIYYEWYGLESSKDQPIVGGFERCEELYKKTWRKSHNPREKKHYSRLQAIIWSLQKKAASEERRMEQVATHLQWYVMLWDGAVKWLRLWGMNVVRHMLDLVTNTTTLHQARPLSTFTLFLTPCWISLEKEAEEIAFPHQPHRIVALEFYSRIFDEKERRHHAKGLKVPGQRHQPHYNARQKNCMVLKWIANFFLLYQAFEQLLDPKLASDPHFYGKAVANLEASYQLTGVFGAGCLTAQLLIL
jgi:hypothetical protein